MIAPGSATATVWPASTFGAPQTIVRDSPSPASTVVTRRRSASGCCSAVSTLPTTNRSGSPTPTGSIFSTSAVDDASRSASAGAGIIGSQYDRSQSIGTLIAPSSELLQEAQVVVEDRAQ